MSLSGRYTRSAVFEASDGNAVMDLVLPGSSPKFEREVFAERRTLKPGCGCSGRPVSPVRARAAPVAALPSRRLSPIAEEPEYVTRRVAGQELVTPTRLSPTRASRRPLSPREEVVPAVPPTYTERDLNVKVPTELESGAVVLPSNGESHVVPRGSIASEPPASIRASRRLAEEAELAPAPEVAVPAAGGRGSRRSTERYYRGAGDDLDDVAEEEEYVGARRQTGRLARGGRKRTETRKKSPYRR